MILQEFEGKAIQEVAYEVLASAVAKTYGSQEQPKDDDNSSDEGESELDVWTENHIKINMSKSSGNFQLEINKLELQSMQQSRSPESLKLPVEAIGSKVRHRQ